MDALSSQTNNTFDNSQLFDYFDRELFPPYQSTSYILLGGLNGLPTVNLFESDSNEETLIANSKFFRNELKPLKGGAIYFSKSYNFVGSLEIDDCLFEETETLEGGSGIAVDVYNW